ncbi:6-phosphogluconolactonase [Amaricoccus macauensis]|uniref:6-phosphogluconolactonase n=1 Tax=Amaricoccus macauensis TaxID=57001 RepID=UPI003C7DA16F
MTEVAFTPYPDRDTLMRSLADLVADQLRAAHASKGRATLAVPGGTTPGPFLEWLSQEDLEWADITVLLTDERRVPEGSERSNLRLIKGTLVQNAASSVQLIDFNAGDGALAQAASEIEAVLPIDVLVIGMGADMHTASLFPDAPQLGDALAEDAPVLMPIQPASQPEERLTLTAPVLKAAGAAHILITGPEKKAALETALTDGPAADAPIRVVLNAPCPVTVHYAE